MSHRPDVKGFFHEPSNTVSYVVSDPATVDVQLVEATGAHVGTGADGPRGQLEPPTPKDFPTFGSQVIRLKPPEVPMLPFVMMPRPLQESGVVGKGGAAGFLGR